MNNETHKKAYINVSTVFLQQQHSPLSKHSNAIDILSLGSVYIVYIIESIFYVLPELHLPLGQGCNTC
jgi:hypothetical protein